MVSSTAATLTGSFCLCLLWSRAFIMIFGWETLHLGLAASPPWHIIKFAGLQQEQGQILSAIEVMAMNSIAARICTVSP